MGTVHREQADKVVQGNGYYPGDEHLPPVVRIVEYDNAFGGVAYGLEYPHTLGAYQESEFVRNPRVYWERPS